MHSRSIQTDCDLLAWQDWFQTSQGGVLPVFQPDVEKVWMHTSFQLHCCHWLSWRNRHVSHFPCLTSLHTSLVFSNLRFLLSEVWSPKSDKCLMFYFNGERNGACVNSGIVFPIILMEATRCDIIPNLKSHEWNSLQLLEVLFIIKMEINYLMRNSQCL